jgi:hypothetical protein
VFVGGRCQSSDDEGELKMEFGDLPNSLNFVSTFIAAIAAISALKFTKKLLEGDDWRNK